MTDLFLRKVILSFARAFAAAFLLLAPGILAAPNMDEGRAALIAALIASFSAGLRALQALFTHAETP